MQTTQVFRFGILLLFLASFSCRGDGSASKSGAPTKADQAAPARTGMAADVENICFAEQRSGAFDIDESVRQVHVAQWLASKIQSEEARTFLAALAQAEPVAKVDLLRAKAKEHGMTDCPLADAWSGG